MAASHCRALKVGGTCLVLLWCIESYAQSLGADDLIDLPLEDLMQMDATVTSASKRDEVLKDTPAAIFIISREDIRRSAATTVPDALRIAPGLQVAHISSNEWAVSARGLGGRFSRYLLVLIDGRSLYTSLFSGVNWDEQNLSLENIERIEVIRGPGGSMWGANAVNGVINIITRKPDSDNGFALRATAGADEERGSVYGRTDFATGVGGVAFISADIKSTRPLRAASVELDSEGVNHQRIDGGWWQEGSLNTFTAMAGWWQQESMVPWTMQLLTPPWQVPVYGQEHKTGYYGSLKWTLPTSNGEWNFLLNGDDTRRDSTAYQWDTRNLDMEWQWSGKVWPNHTLVAGLLARYTLSDFSVPSYGMEATLEPGYLVTHTQSVYLQDSIALAPSFDIALSARLDHYSLTSSAFQPAVRFLWQAAPNHRFWLGVSRANSTPSRVLNSRSSLEITTVPPSEQTPLPVRIALQADGHVLADVKLTAYEVGYRFVPRQQFSLDATAFIHRYNHILGVQQGTPQLRDQQGQPYLYLPYAALADSQRVNKGVELAASYPVTTNWFTQYSGSFMAADYGREDSNLSAQFSRADAVPKWQHSLRSLWNFNRTTQLNLQLRYVAALPNTTVASYWTADIKADWQFARAWHLSLNGRNLINGPYVEGSREIFNVGDYEVAPSWYLKMVWAPNAD